MLASGLSVRFDPILGISAGLCQDADLDGTWDSLDNCPGIWNADQRDTDADSLGNACDNCPAYANADQADADDNGFGDICQDLTGDLDADGDIDVVDVDACVARRNQAATGPADPMDLDGDGWITALDARKLVLLCSLPECAAP